jgi:hypothetical protein
LTNNISTSSADVNNFGSQNNIKRIKNDVDSTKVSFLLLDNFNKNTFKNLLDSLATSINVQLTLLDRKEIPFIPFNEYTNTLYEDKVYIRGLSGSGKSRCIYEIVKTKISSFERIFIINPRNITVNAKETGRVDIYNLTKDLKDKDIVIWDNFPDDLVKKDIDYAKKVLELISSQNAGCILIALKPKYLEFYNGIESGIIGLYKCDVEYGKDRFQNILKAYGYQPRFERVYNAHVIKNLDKITNVLWNKEPIPLTVLDYYKELVRKDNVLDNSNNFRKAGNLGKILDAVFEADNLLLSTDFHTNQFKIICANNDRHIETEFLYTLRLAYEIGYSRTIDSINELQKDIFNSHVSEKDVNKKLSTWVYMSGPFYSMHDTSRNSITFENYINAKIMNYLSNNFLKIISERKTPVYLLGKFFGNKFQFIPNNNQNENDFLPLHIY